MKIAIITAELPYPSNSGGRIYTWNRIKELKKLGHNIVLYSFKDSKEEVVEEEKILKYCSKVNVYERNKSTINKIKGCFRAYSAISRYNKELVESIEKEESLDIIIVDMPQLLYNLPKVKKVPIVLTQHNIEYKTFKNIGDKSNKLIKKIIFKLEAFKLFLFEKNIYNSNLIDLYTFISIKDKLFFETKFGKKNSILIPFGYQVVEKNKKRNSKKIKKIVFTGKMDYLPNKEAVLWFTKQILPKIKMEINDVKFFIVGKNPDQEIISLQNENIVVTGTVESVEQYIDDADIVVIPLLSGGGVKIKLIEALGRGSTVITTSKGVEGTIFENNKHLLIEDDSQMFAERCIQVLENSENFNELSVNAQAVISEQYSWKAISEFYEKSLYKIIYENKIN